MWVRLSLASRPVTVTAPALPATWSSSPSVPASRSDRRAVAAGGADVAGQVEVDSGRCRCPTGRGRRTRPRPPAPSRRAPRRPRGRPPRRRSKRTLCPTRKSRTPRRRWCRRNMPSRACRCRRRSFGAVARVPREAVEVAAHARDVVALVAVHVVEPVAADQHVVAGAAEQRAAAVAAVEREVHLVGRGADLVFAFAGVDAQPVEAVGPVDLTRRSGRARTRVAEAADRRSAPVRGAVGDDAVDHSSAPRSTLTSVTGRLAGRRYAVLAVAGGDVDGPPSPCRPPFVEVGAASVPGKRGGVPRRPRTGCDRSAARTARSRRHRHALKSIASRRPSRRGPVVIVLRAGEHQRALLDPRATVGVRRDELALAVAGPARLTSPPIFLAKARASSASSSAATSSRCRSCVTEPPNRRCGASGSATRPLRSALALTCGTSSSIASTSGRRRSGVEREDGSLQEAAADGLGDAVQLAALGRVDVEAAGTLERRQARPSKNTPSSSSEPRGLPPPSRTMCSTRSAKRYRRSSSRGSPGS